MPVMLMDSAWPLIVADVHGVKGQTAAEGHVYAQRTFQVCALLYMAHVELSAMDLSLLDRT